MTKEQIDTQYKTIHDSLEVQYYTDGSLTKEQFDTQHGANWDNHKQALIDGGYLTADPE